METPDKKIVTSLLESGEEKVLLDLEIIENLKEQVSRMRKRFSDYGIGTKKFILIRDSVGIHILSTKRADSFHGIIAIIYSIYNEYRSVHICGGGTISLIYDHGNEELLISGKSDSFGSINQIELEKVAVLNSIDIKLKINSSEKPFREYTYEELEHLLEKI